MGASTAHAELSAVGGRLEGSLSASRATISATGRSACFKLSPPLPRLSVFLSLDFTNIEVISISIHFTRKTHPRTH